MTEKSLFWDDGATGDQAYSPYDSNEFSLSWLERVFAAYNTGYVVPSYGSDLDISVNTGADRALILSSGAAFVKGYFYENSSTVNISLAENVSGSPRLDRIVLRVDWEERTVRVEVLEGTPTATPTLPELTQEAGEVWEETLYYVWVEPSAGVFSELDIHDEREFGLSFKKVSSKKNYIVNSEFMAWSGYNSGVSAAIPLGSNIDLYYMARRYKPDYWTVEGFIKPSSLSDSAVASHPGWTRDTPPAQQRRGHTVMFSTNADLSGISQKAFIAPDEKYTVKVLVFVPRGSIGVVAVETDGSTPIAKYKYIRRTGEWVEYVMRFTAPANATFVTVKLLAAASNTKAKFGQCMLVQGYNAGPFRPVHETLLFDTYVGLYTRQVIDYIWIDTGTGSVVIRGAEVATNVPSNAATVGGAYLSIPSVDRIFSTLAPGIEISTLYRIDPTKAYMDGQNQKIPEGTEEIFIALGGPIEPPSQTVAWGSIMSTGNTQWRPMITTWAVQTGVRRDAISDVALRIKNTQSANVIGYRMLFLLEVLTNTTTVAAFIDITPIGINT
jgi:hypothetical protein